MKWHQPISKLLCILWLLLLFCFNAYTESFDVHSHNPQNKMVLEISGLKDVYKLGSEIAFDLQLRNVGNNPVTIIALTNKMIQTADPALAIEFSVTRPDGSRFKIIPSRALQIHTQFQHLDLEEFGPGGAGKVGVEWRNFGMLQNSVWLLYHESEVRAYPGSLTYKQQNNLLAECFNSSGRYEVTLDLAMTKLPHGEDDPFPKNFWQGHASPKLTFIISGT